MKNVLYLLILLLITSCSPRGFNTVRVSPLPAQVQKPTASLTPTASLPIPNIQTTATFGVSKQKEIPAEKPAITRQRFDKSKLGKAFKITGGVVMAGGFAVFLLGHKQSKTPGTLTLKNILKQIASTSLMMTGLMIIGAGLLLFLIGVIIYRRNTYGTQGGKPLY